MLGMETFWGPKEHCVRCELSFRASVYFGQLLCRSFIAMCLFSNTLLNDSC